MLFKPEIIDAADKYADAHDGAAIPSEDVRAAINNAFFAGAIWQAKQAAAAMSPHPVQGVQK